MTKTATVSLHGNQYEVDAALTGRKVELLADAPLDPRDRLRVRAMHVQHSRRQVLPEWHPREPVMRAQPINTHRVSPCWLMSRSPPSGWVRLQ
ncbi:MAG: hypothetical protein JO168_05270 [Solirubrobacterales bacterium]|nr:hypothetical protein [Solirubrobacterales bacterium]